MPEQRTQLRPLGVYDDPESKPVDFSSFSTWAAETNADVDDAKSRSQYGDYVRNSYLEAGLLDNPEEGGKIESYIQEGVITSLSEGGFVDLDDPEAVEEMMSFGNDTPLDKKLGYIQNYYDEDSEEWNIAEKYLRNNEALGQATSDVAEDADVLDRASSYEEQALALINGDAYQKALQYAVDSGATPMARLRDKETGEEYYKGGKMLDGMSYADAVKISIANGSLSPSDSGFAGSLFQKQRGSALPEYKRAALSKTDRMLSVMSSRDEEGGGMNDEATIMKMDVINEKLEDGEDADKELAELYQYLEYSRLLDKGELPDFEDFKVAATENIKKQNLYKKEVKAAGDADVGSNLLLSQYNDPVLHPAAAVNDEVFRATLLAHPELGEDQIKALVQSREDFITANYGSYGEILSKSKYADKWNKHRDAGLAAGKKKRDILTEYMSDPDNYNQTSDFWSGIGASITEAYEGLGAAIPAIVFDSEWGKGVLQKNAEDSMVRREVASMYGNEYGMTRDVAETLAPMLADMAVSTALAVGTAHAGGAGGVAYAVGASAARNAAMSAAKAGIKGAASKFVQSKAFTASYARQFGKTIKTRAFMPKIGEGVEEAAERLALTNKITGGAKALKDGSAVEAIKAYNKTFTGKYAAQVGVALPAANRSAGATYGTVYNQLDGLYEDMGEEEKNDIAMGAALQAGAFTGLLTSAFGMFGFGGIDDALLNGATASQLRTVMGPLLSRGGEPMSKGVFNKVASGLMTELIKKNRLLSVQGLKESATGAIEEGLEEGIDEFVNGLVIDASTDQETPFLDRMLQSFHAAQVGGIIGAGVPVVQRVGAFANANKALALDPNKGARIEADFTNELTKRLSDKGSPLSADVVSGILNSSARNKDVLYEDRLSAHSIVKKNLQTLNEAQNATPDELAELSGVTDFDMPTGDAPIPKNTPISDLSAEQQRTYAFQRRMREVQTEPMGESTRMDVILGERKIEAGTPLWELSEREYTDYTRAENKIAELRGDSAPDIPAYDSKLMSQKRETARLAEEEVTQEQSKKRSKNIKDEVPTDEAPAFRPIPTIESDINNITADLEKETDEGVVLALEDERATLINELDEAVQNEAETGVDQADVNAQLNEETNPLETKTGKDTPPAKPVAAEAETEEEVEAEEEDVPEAAAPAMDEVRKNLKSVNAKLARLRKKHNALKDANTTAQTDTEVEPTERKHWTDDPEIYRQVAELGAEIAPLREEAASLKATLEEAKEQAKAVAKPAKQTETTITESGAELDNGEAGEDIEGETPVKKVKSTRKTKSKTYGRIPAKDIKAGTSIVYYAADASGPLQMVTANMSASEFSVLPEGDETDTRVVEVTDADTREVYYLVGKDDTPLVEMERVSPNEEFAGINTEDPSLVAYPSKDVRKARRNQSMDALTNPDQLRSLESVAVERLRSNPLDIEAQTQMGYAQSKLADMGEASFVDTEKARQVDEKETEQANRILTAWERQSRSSADPDDANFVPPKQEFAAEAAPTEDDLNGKNIKPWPYKPTDNEREAALLDALSDEALAELVPIDSAPQKLASLRGEQALSSPEAVQQWQINQIRDIILSGYPVTIGQGEARGLLPQSKDFLSQVDLPEGEDIKSWRKYFRHVISSKIAEVYPTIDTSTYVEASQSNVELAKKRAAKASQTAAYVEWSPPKLQVQRLMENDTKFSNEIDLESKTQWSDDEITRAEQVFSKISQDPELHSATKRAAATQLKAIAQARKDSTRPKFKPDLSKGIQAVKTDSKVTNYAVNEDGSISLMDSGKATYFINKNGSGIFNNDPVIIAEMLLSGVPVKIPKAILTNTGEDSTNITRSQINPAIKYDQQGNVYRVLRLNGQGNNYEVVQHSSRLSGVMPDEGYSEKTASVVKAINAQAVDSLRVNAANLASDAKAYSENSNHIILEAPKESYEVSQILDSFEGFIESARRWLDSYGGNPVPESIEGESQSRRDRRAEMERVNARQAAFNLTGLFGLNRASNKGRTMDDFDSAPLLNGLWAEYTLMVNLAGIRAQLAKEQLISSETKNGKSTGKFVAKTINGKTDKAVDRFLEFFKFDSTEEAAAVLGERMRIQRSFYDPAERTYQAMSAEAKVARNKKVVLAYLEQHVLNHDRLSDGVAPSLTDIGRTVRDRIRGQNEVRSGRDPLANATSTSGDSEGNMMTDTERAALYERQGMAGVVETKTNLTDLDRTDDDAVGTEETDGFNIGMTEEQVATLGQRFLDQRFKEANASVVETINADPKAKRAFVDMLRTTIHADQHRPDKFYETMNVSMLWSAMAGSVTHATHKHNADMLSFLKLLKFNALESQRDMVDAVKYVLFPDNVSETFAKPYQEQLIAWGVPVSGKAGLVKTMGFLNNLSKTLQSHHAEAAITEAQRGDAIIANTADAERLGLVNGDPSSVVKALNVIKQTSANENHKLVAELLLEDPDFIQSVDFRMSKQSDLSGGRYDLGTDGSHTVSLNIAGYNGRGLENVLLEEYIHAYLSETLSKPASQLTAQQKAGVERLKGLHKLAKAAYEKEGIKHSSVEYSLQNMTEFVAALLVNPDFQTFIKSIEPQGKQRGLLPRLVEAIFNMLRSIAGKKLTETEASAYQEALTDVIDLARSSATSDRPSLEALAGNVIAEKIKDNTARTDSIKNLLSIAPSMEGTTLRPAPNTIPPLVDAGRDVFKKQPIMKEMWDTDMDADQLTDYITDTAIPFIRAFTPSEVEVVIVNQTPKPHGQEHAMFMKGGKLYVSPRGLASLVAQIEGDGKNNSTALEATFLSIIDEEVSHVASYLQLSATEITQVGKALGMDGLSEVAREYYTTPEQADAAIARLRSENPDEAKAEADTLVEEHLRMQSQRALRGYTTEEDLLFYRTNPSLFKVLGRYIFGSIKALVNRLAIHKRKDLINTKVIRLTAELRRIKASYRSGKTVELFDPNNPEHNINVLRAISNEPMTQEIEALMNEAVTERAEEVDTPAVNTMAGLGLDMSKLDFDHVPHLFEMPAIASGAYAKPNKISRLFMGDADPRVTRLYQQYQSWMKEGEETVRRFETTFHKLVVSAYGSKEEAPHSVIAKAIGTNMTIDIDPEIRAAIEDSLDAELKAINKNQSLKGDAQVEARKDARAGARKRYADKLKDAFDARLASTRVEQEQAINTIKSTSPELAEHILVMRNDLIDELSKIIKNTYNTKDDGGVDNYLGIKIDASLGVYVTRSYRMFTDPTYYQTIRDSLALGKEGDHEALINEAESLFRTQYMETQREKNSKLMQDNRKSDEEVDQESLRFLQENPDYAREQLLKFVDSYQSSRTGGSNAGLDPVTDSLKRKEDLPEVLRKALGEHTNEEEGLTNLLRSYATVMTMASKQSFLNNVVTLGRALHDSEATIEDKFLMTPEEWEEARMVDPDRYGGWQKIQGSRTSIHDPLLGLRAPPEVVEDLANLTASMMHDPHNDAAKLMRRMSTGLSRASGAAMGIKTLGNPGFYVRNAVSNVLFFGPSQGFFDVPKMVSQFKQSLRDMSVDGVDARLIRYNGLRLLGDNMRTEVIRELLHGKAEENDVMRELNIIQEKISKIEAAEGLGKAGSWVSQKTEKLYERARDLADAMDAFYKIAYFEHERGILQDAKDLGMGDRYSEMSDRQLELEAAHKVHKTAQMASQRVEIAKEYAKSPAGFLFAPFIGFTADVFRIPINTWKMVKEEISDANPVIRRRGTRRRTGLLSVMVGGSAILPTALTLLASGLDLEEKDALMQGEKDYNKGKSYFFFRKADGTIVYVDMTYINPFAMLVDPALRAGEQLFLGNFKQTAVAMMKGWVGDTIAKEQIFAGAAWQLFRNQDAATGAPIYDMKVDGIDELLIKMGDHLWTNAFEPNLARVGGEVLNRAGMETESFDESAFGQAASLIYPTRIKTLDVERNFRRMMFAEKDSANNSRKQLFELYKRAPMTDEAVRDIYTDYYERSYKHDQRLYRYTKAFQSLGITDYQMRTLMVKGGFGKRHTDNILYLGITESPSISPRLMQGLEERGLITRANAYFKAYANAVRVRSLRQ